MLIVFQGPPCSGKTTLAAEIARRRGLAHLSMDATRMRILPHAPHTRADREVAYHAMHFAAELLAQVKAGVVLDAPYGHPEDRAELAAVVQRTGAALRTIECHVSEEAAVRRFRARGPDSVRLDLTEEAVAAMVREFVYTGTGLTLDTDVMSEAACFRRIEEYLGD